MPQFTNPPPAPIRGDRATFSGRVDAFLQWLVAFVSQLNIFAANLNARDAGGAGTFSFTFDPSTSDSDPGPGKLRFDSATQNAAVTIRIDNSTDSNIDIGAYLQSLQNGTSNVKGSLRIEKAKNPGSWVLFDIFTVTDASGYRNLSVVPRASSSINPFSAGDPLVVFFDRAGDRGDGGNTPTQQQIRDAIGVVPVSSGGTGATTALQALSNLGGLARANLDPILASGEIGRFAAGTPVDGVSARFMATQQIASHAQYAFLDNSTITYAQAGFQGHASFNDNVKHTGSQNSDHHHSFQAYPHYGNTGTIGRLSCFWAQPDVTAGTVTELSQFKASNPLGSGAISSLYGLYIEPLTRGTANYAIYVAGTTVSYFGGALALGQIANPAYVMYNPNSGNLDLTPRTGYGVAVVGGPLLFGADTGSPAKIAYNSNGNLDFTPRAGYHTTVTAGSLLIGPSLPAAGEKLNVTGATSDFLARLYNNDTNPKGLALVYGGASPNGTGNEFLYCQDSTGIRAKILSNGNVQNLNNSYGGLSDRKLKENIVDASPKLADLLRVRIVNANFINDPSKAKQLCVIAQELAPIFPGLVEETIDYEYVEVEPGKLERRPTGTTTLSVKYSVFVPILIKAMQEQEEEKKGIMQRLEALERHFS